MADNKTRPPFNPDPHRHRNPLLDQGIAAGGTSRPTLDPPPSVANHRPSKTTGYVLIPSGALFILAGLALLFGTHAVSAWIFGGVLATIGATAVIVGSALLSVLGAL